MQQLLFRLRQKIFKDERMPKSWNEAYNIPIYKKGDKSNCENYRFISLLKSPYNIFMNVLLKRLTPYVEENLGR